MRWHQASCQGGSGVASRRSPASRSEREQFIEDGDTVVVLGAEAWKHKASGEPAEVKMAHVWTVANGKLTRFQQHVDTARVRELIA